MTSFDETEAPDELLGALRALPSHDTDALRAQRVQARSHRILAKHRRRARRMRAAAARLYSGYLEPALAVGLAGAILLWAFERAHFLLS